MVPARLWRHPGPLPLGLAAVTNVPFAHSIRDSNSTIARVNGFSVRAASIRVCITCDMMPRRHGDSIEYHRNSPEISGVIGDRDVPCGFAAIRGTLFEPAEAAKRLPVALRQIGTTGNIPLHRDPKSIVQLRPSRSGKRGGRASSRTRDGMWWTRQRRHAVAVAGRVEPRERFAGAQDERRFSVRQNRVVLTPQRLASSLRRFCEPNRADKTNSQATVSNKPDRRGEHGISRKAITQGMPDASAEPVCSCVHPLSHCARDRGCSVHPAFPAPFRG
jgi:hypothetical protein